MYTKNKPTVNGKYRLKMGSEPPRVVTVEVANDHIWDHDMNCMRSLGTMYQPQYGVEWEAVEDDE